VAAGDTRNAILKDALVAATTAKDASKHYIRVMEKIVNGTENYIEKEVKRCVLIPCGCHSSSSCCDTIDEH
jgi:protein disulfide-isomerase A6